MSTTTLDDLNQVRPQIDAMSDDGIVSISMPLKHYLQEAMKVLKLIESRREYLEKNGMDVVEVLKIAVLIGACRDIYGQFAMISFPTSASSVAWGKKRDEAEELLYDLLVALDYAFQGHPELLSLLSTIRQGGSNADFIQDLTDAHVLGRENRALLEAIHYDMANVEQASVLSKELSELLAQATIDKSNSPELRIARDKAFSLLKLALDKAIKQARYIYRKDKKIAGSFIVNPPVRRRSKSVSDAIVVAEDKPANVKA